MARPKQPPRLYLDPSRQEWVLRYENWFKRTGFPPEDKAKAQELLDRVLGHNSWVRALRVMRPARREKQQTPWCRDKTVGHVYFVSATNSEGYPIKIGFCTENMAKRLSELQVGNPHQLAVLCSHPATYAHEQAIHTRLKEHRLSGEWFSRAAEVLAVLELAKGAALEQWLAAA